MKNYKYTANGKRVASTLEDWEIDPKTKKPKAKAPKRDKEGK